MNRRNFLKAALREQLAERDAEIKALKGHAMEMRRCIEGIANWRVDECGSYKP